MKSFYVGFTKRSSAHNYESIHRALVLMKGEQVSPRIWKCSIDGAKSDLAFALAKQCLAAEDDMLVVPVPADAADVRFALAA